MCQSLFYGYAVTVIQSLDTASERLLCQITRDEGLCAQLHNDILL